MALKRNANASIWEIIPLFAFRKMFPSLKWSNEYPLKDISANTTVNVFNRRYDLYSPVINAAIEISRVGAHSSEEILERDQLKQKFSNEAHVTLFHIREAQCSQGNFTNVHTFTVGKNTKDINFPIRTLCSAIEMTATDIERQFSIRRSTNINYGHSIGEILDLYERITGKVFCESALEDVNDETLSKKLDMSVDKFVSFRDTRSITSKKAFFEIQNNKPKFVENGNFLAKNVSEASIANQIIKEKNKEIERLQNLVSQFTDVQKHTYKNTVVLDDFEVLKQASRIRLAKQRREAEPLRLAKDKES